jgi:cytochrome c peroxidase
MRSGNLNGLISAKLGGILLLAPLALLCACSSAPSARPVGAPVSITVPLGLPPIPIPKDNPPTAASIALGRRLFYDTRLSKDDSLSCASCHRPQAAFADVQERSLGVGGTLGLRNAPTLVNAAYSPTLFWDGRAKSLEGQVAIPIVDPLEMNQSHDACIAKLTADPSYTPMFQSAFGSSDVTMERVQNALASFERTILSGDSPFDEYEYGGHKEALTPAQIRGLAVFTDPAKGNCAACHTIGPHFALFSDGEFHNTGAGVGGDGEFTDLGRFRVTLVAADGASFKTPTLRNVALTGPYMHDGKLKTLRDVVDFYAGGGNSSPYLDKKIAPLNLTGQEKSDLVEFMKSLTGKLPANAGPPTKDATP